MRWRCAARAMCSRICPSPRRWSTPKRSSRAIPTSSSPLRRRGKVPPGWPTGSASAASPRCAAAASWVSRIRDSAAWVRASSTPPSSCAARSRASVAEVSELQRHFELRALEQRDGRLQLVALLAADAHLVAHEARLHLELGVLDQARDLLAGVRVDAVPQHHLLVRGRERRLRLLHLEAYQVDAALGEPQLEYLQHLLELKVHLRAQRDGELVELEARSGVLEIEALRQLAARLVDGVGHFVGVELRNGIERWHTSLPAAHARRLAARRLAARRLAARRLAARRAVPPRSGARGRLERAAMAAGQVHEA